MFSSIYYFKWNQTLATNFQHKETEKLIKTKEAAASYWIDALLCEKIGYLNLTTQFLSPKTCLVTEKGSAWFRKKIAAPHDKTWQGVHKQKWKCSH